MRIGNMYGPDATFVGVPAADLDNPASFAGAAAVIVGAPFDGGTSHRPGCRFGPQAIRLACYLEHDGRRPSLALGVDGLLDLGVVDAGDVLMPAGEIEASLHRLEQAVEQVAPQRCHPGRPGCTGPHTGLTLLKSSCATDSWVEPGRSWPPEASWVSTVSSAPKGTVNAGAWSRLQPWWIWCRARWTVAVPAAPLSLRRSRPADACRTAGSMGDPRPSGDRRSGDLPRVSSGPVPS
jgi:hypothetical protein